MKVKDALQYFKSFQVDLKMERAQALLQDLHIDENITIRKLFKSDFAITQTIQQ